MTQGIIENLKAHLSRAPGRVILTRPPSPPLGDAIAAAVREGWVRAWLLDSGAPRSGRAGDAAQPRGAHPLIHDARLIQRYLDVWAAIRGPMGVGEQQARTELEQPEAMAAALVLAGEADAVVSGVETASIIRARGTGLSDLVLVHTGTESGCVVVASREDFDPGPPVLAELARRGAEVAQRLTSSSATSIRFVKGQVTASLGSRRRYQSEESAVDGRIAEAIRTTKVRVRDASIGSLPERGFPALGEGLEVAVVSTGSGGDLRYRLEQEYPGARVAGPLLQGALVPTHPVRREASTSEVVEELTLLLIGTVQRRLE